MRWFLKAAVAAVFLGGSGLAWGQELIPERRVVVTDYADDRALRPFGEVRLAAGLFDAGDNVADLGRAGSGNEDDDHWFT